MLYSLTAPAPVGGNLKVFSTPLGEFQNGLFGVENYAPNIHRIFRKALMAPPCCYRPDIMLSEAFDRPMAGEQ